MFQFWRRQTIFFFNFKGECGVAENATKLCTHLDPKRGYFHKGLVEGGRGMGGNVRAVKCCHFRTGKQHRRRREHLL